MLRTLLAFGPLLVVVLMDMQNLLSWSRSRVLPLADAECDDFTIIVPLYGDPSYFSERRRIVALKERVLVSAAMDTPAMRTGADELEAEGWRVLRVEVGGARSTAPILMQAALESGEVKTTYAARLDADTVPTPGFERAVEAIRRDGTDLASLKCHILEPRTLCERMQAQEYRMAMLSRHFRPRLTSGAGYIGRTEALRQIFRLHTGVFFSEDVETGRIAWQLRMRIRHVDYEILTAGPPTWPALWRQRTSWWAGNVHHFWVNFDKNALHMPGWTFYYVALVWIGLTWKWTTLFQSVEDPRRGAVFFATMYLLYLAMTYASNWQVRSRYMLLVPPYSLFQAMMMPPVGLVRWTQFCIAERKMYRYRFGYRRRAPMQPLRLRNETPLAVSAMTAKEAP